jgi:PleD family two-component response regulator
VSPLPDSASLRVFLFKREGVDVFHLRLAVGMAFDEYSIHVMEQTQAGLRTACAILHSEGPRANLVLVEQRKHETATVELLAAVRQVPELSSSPVVLLGDAEDPCAERIAMQDGADAFVPLAERASELPRIGRDLARFYSSHGLGR